MRKKIYLSMILVVLASALVGGAAFALFTDQATNEGNTFTAGTVDVNLGGTLPFNVTNMAPGDSATRYVEIRNSGTLDMLFRGYVTATTNTALGGATFADQLQVTVTLRPSDYEYPEGYTPYGPTNAPIYSGPLSGLIGVDNALDNVDAAFVDGWPLMPGYVAVYKMVVELPLETGNEWQNAQFVGNLVVDGTQFAHQEQGSVQW
ncbi:MAG: TasA family protein [Bacillota bacterium]